MTGLCTVVPLNTTNPIQIEPLHLMDPRSLPGRLAQNDTWAKCDMLNTVSVDRLSRATSRRQRLTFRMLEADLNAIRNCVKIALGLDRAPR